MTKRPSATERLCSGDMVRATVLRTPTDRLVCVEVEASRKVVCGDMQTSPSPVRADRWAFLVAPFRVPSVTELELDALLTSNAFALADLERRLAALQKTTTAKESTTESQMIASPG